MASATRNQRHRVDGIDVGSVSVDDRGLLYGDGVFRTLRIERGHPWAFPQQIETLLRDAVGTTGMLCTSSTLSNRCVRVFGRVVITFCFLP